MVTMSACSKHLSVFSGTSGLCRKIFSASAFRWPLALRSLIRRANIQTPFVGRLSVLGTPDQCDDMTSDEWTKLHRKKATVLLILDRHTINAEELRMKIMGEIFFPSDWASVRSWLTEKGLSWEDKPIFFDGEYLMKFGVKIKQWEDEPDMVRCERAWLRQACHLLDITYEEKIEGYEYGTKSIVIDIPRGWDFNPKRQVSMMDICPSCKRMAPYEEMRYILRHGESLCSSCVRPLSCPGDRLESESIDQADSDFEYEDEDTHDSSSSLSYGSLSEKPCADEENDYESDEEFQ